MLISVPGVIGARGVRQVSYTRQLTIDHTLVPSTQTNFPVLVNATNATLKTIANGGHVQRTDGFDIGFFADAAGTTPLKWEIPPGSYNPATGDLSAWVKIGSLSSGSDTVFYLRYGSPSITTDQSDPVNVWDTHYKRIYHLGDGTTLSLVDSTGNSAGSNGGAVAATGKISGGAQTGSGTYIADTNVINVGTGTLSMWVNILGTPGGGTNNNLIGLMDGLNSGIHERQIGVNSTGAFEFYAWDGTQHLLAGPTVTTGAWYYLTGVQNGSVATFYVNGTSVASVGCGPGYTAYSVPNLYLGGQSGGGFPISAILDEARFSDIERSADWVATEYNNQLPSGVFITLGPEI